MSAAYNQVQFRLDFFMDANNMNPGQTAPKEQSDLGHIVCKNTGRQEVQMTKVGTCELRVYK